MSAPTANEVARPTAQEGQITVTPKKRGGDRITGSLPPGNYTRTQTADRVGMPVETLRRWLRDGTYVPHANGYEKQHGKTSFHIYTEDDVAQLRALCKSRNVKHRVRPLRPGE